VRQIVLEKILALATLELAIVKEYAISNAKKRQEKEKGKKKKN